VGSRKCIRLSWSGIGLGPGLSSEIILRMEERISSMLGSDAKFGLLMRCHPLLAPRKPPARGPALPRSYNGNASPSMRLRNLERPEKPRAHAPSLRQAVRLRQRNMASCHPWQLCGATRGRAYFRKLILHRLIWAARDPSPDRPRVAAAPRTSPCARRRR
jgi:hypothetical protein